MMLACITHVKANIIDIIDKKSYGNISKVGQFQQKVKNLANLVESSANQKYWLTILKHLHTIMTIKPLTIKLATLSLTVHMSKDMLWSLSLLYIFGLFVH